MGLVSHETWREGIYGGGSTIRPGTDFTAWNQSETQRRVSENVSMNPECSFGKRSMELRITPRYLREIARCGSSGRRGRIFYAPWRE